MLRTMANTIRHRGPDDEGCEVFGQVGLAFRRLAIIDLSAAGHQPMTNEDGTVWIVFNGEIYNYQELHADLAGRHKFRSADDTEVLLHLYEERGDAMLDALDGMFAFAIYDQNRRSLLLGAIHSGSSRCTTLSTSDVWCSARRSSPCWHPERSRGDIRPHGAKRLFRLSLDPAPRSIFAAGAQIAAGAQPGARSHHLAKPLATLLAAAIDRLRRPVAGRLGERSGRRPREVGA